MDIKTLFSIEEVLGTDKNFIEKARFMANQIDNEYFVYADSAKSIAAKYQALKSAFEILYDYIIYADEETKKAQEIVSQTLDKAQEVKAA